MSASTEVWGSRVNGKRRPCCRLFLFLSVCLPSTFPTQAARLHFWASASASSHTSSSEQMNGLLLPEGVWYQAWPWHPFFYSPTCHHLYIYPPSWPSKFNLILVNKSSLNTYYVQGNVHRDEKASVSMQSSHFSRETTKMASPPGPTTVAMGICPWGLPCGSVAETLHSHCRRPEFSPWSGN